MIKFTRIVKIMGLIAVWAFLFMTTEAHAQSQWGYGMYGGNQQCQYEVDIGDEATSIQDAIDELKDTQADLKEKIKDLKSETTKLKSQMSMAHVKLSTRGFKSDALRFLDKHIANQPKRCCDYNNVVCESGTDRVVKACRDDADCSTDNSTENAPAGPKRGTDALAGFSYDDWGKACNREKPGEVRASVACSAKGAIVESSLYRQGDCETALTDWQRIQGELRGKDGELKALEAEQKVLTAQIAGMKGDKKKAIRAYEKELKAERTEGGCVDCDIARAGGVNYKKKNNTGEIIGNVALGLASTFAGYKLNTYMSDQNAQLGWASQPYPALMYGFPYYANALYGAIGGGVGQGSFGCAGSGGGQNGAFGYPQGMAGNGQGGGMYMPGMGPWGMNGMNGGGNGMGGYMMGNMMGGGAMMGSMMGGNMMGMMAGGGYMMSGGMMMGNMMGLMSSGGMMGTMTGGGGMMGNMMSGGYMMGGGGMMGNMMSGGYMMGGGGMMGNMMSGGYMMGGGGMMGNMMSGGYMMGGGGMMGNMMGGGGYMMSGGLMAGTMTGGGMMGSMMGDGGAAMQMQQQMMQMQQQMYTQYQQQQQAKQTALYGLQSELSNLMNRIQQVQMGVNTGGYIGFGTTTGGANYNSGSVPVLNTLIPGSTSGTYTTPVNTTPR